MFNIFCRFLGRSEGDRGGKGDNDHLLNAFVHCPMSLQGDKCFKVAENYLYLLSMSPRPI